MDPGTTGFERSLPGANQGRSGDIPRRALSQIQASSCGQTGPYGGAATYQSENQPFQLVGRKEFQRHAVVPVNYPVGQEQLATSTRKLPAAVWDENENFETIDHFKSRLDHDREKWAKKMALRMLNVKGLQNGA